MAIVKDSSLSRMANSEDLNDDDDDEPGEVIESAPPLRVGEEREIRHSGLKKKLLKRGISWETPNPGDEVTVHYVGTMLNGTMFDSTRENCQPFTFKLGHGEIAEGLDMGIMTMKKGEVAFFTLPPELAHGTGGSDKVPSDAVVQFEVELISWIMVMDVCKDGGIIKRVLEKGQDDNQPSELDEVLVKYQIMLSDGTIVAKTPEEGVHFYINDGHLLPALGKAIKTMKVGEKANLIVQPQYGFGGSAKDAGTMLSSIPPNSSLDIKLELVSLKRVIDICSDSKVIKKILEEGKSLVAADEGATVTVRYIAKLEDGTVFEKKGFDSEPPLEFITDEEHVIPGLDRAVATMKKGERALLTIRPEYGFGAVEVEKNHTPIPPLSTLIYEIEMVDFIKEKAPWELTSEEGIMTAGKIKEEGNVLFKSGKYQRARKKYDKAAEYISEETSVIDEQQKQVKSLRVQCWLNGAACSLKLDDFKEAIEQCSKVLDIESCNIKALYRRAQAFMENADLDLAELDIKKALEFDPGNREVKLIQKTLKQRQAESNQHDAKLYANMFSAPARDSMVANKRYRAEDNSFPRHPRSRKVLASTRRDSLPIAEASSTVIPMTHSTKAGIFVAADYEEMVHSEGFEIAYEEMSSHSSDFEADREVQEEVQQVRNVRKGKGGRFIASQGFSSSTRRQLKRKDDDSWLVQGSMLGGPKDGSVIPSFAAHAACSIWDGCDRGVLTCHTRHSTCARLREWREEFVELTSDASGTFRQRTRDEVRTDKIISASGLSALPRIMYQHIDAPLLSAFVERWQPDTNSFHMPFGEMTIMLHDVAYILGLPIEGKVVTGHSKIEDAMDDVYELLGVPELTLANDDDYVSGGVTEESFFNLCCAEGRVPETRATGYMFLTLGSTIFVDKGDSRLRPGLISELMDEASVGTYSWGSATLAYLYRQLGIASRQRCKALAGCLTLLQAWIYEYFPCFRPHQKRLTLRDGDPRCCMWDVRPEPKSRNRLVAFRNRIDNMTVDEVMWLPYGPNSIERCRRTMFTGFIMHHSIVEPYMAYRCVRQIGFMQFIPPRIPRPVKAYRPEEPKNYYVEWPYNLAQDSWDTFPVSFCLNPCSLAYCQNTGACTDDYLNWFTTYSHPFVVNDIDVVPSHGLDATVGEYWMARLSEKATILFDPLVEQLPQQFDTLRLGLHDLRNELKQFETVGVRRPMPQSMPPGWGGQG